MEDIYSFNGIEENLDSDEITGAEFGFMIGYLGAF